MKYSIIFIASLSATETAKNEEPLKQELAAAVEDNDDDSDMEEFDADTNADADDDEEEPAYGPNAQQIRRPSTYTRMNSSYNYEC